LPDAQLPDFASIGLWCERRLKRAAAFGSAHELTLFRATHDSQAFPRSVNSARCGIQRDERSSEALAEPSELTLMERSREGQVHFLRS
jgi:hypothetical protein